MTHVSRWSSVQQGVWKARGVSSMSKVWIQRGYLAPELISPVAHPTPASDWWSIGALMYHLLTGQVMLCVIKLWAVLQLVNKEVR